MAGLADRRGQLLRFAMAEDRERHLRSRLVHAKQHADLVGIDHELIVDLL
jgi:hypothetical protein